MLFPDSTKTPRPFGRKALADPVFPDSMGRAGNQFVDLRIGSFERAEHTVVTDDGPWFILNGMGLIDPADAAGLLRQEVSNTSLTISCRMLTPARADITSVPLPPERTLREFLCRHQSGLTLR